MTDNMIAFGIAIGAHCETCSCHRSPPSPRVVAGTMIRDRVTGQVGRVADLQMPNPPWHNGGNPRVVDSVGNHLGYWYYYDLAEGG